MKHSPTFELAGSAGRELRLALAPSCSNSCRESNLFACGQLLPTYFPDCIRRLRRRRKRWPHILKRIAAEAWRRADAGELEDEELYPSDAQWSGLYDRMFPHKADEMERRLALAADYGEANAADVLN